MSIFALWAQYLPLFLQGVLVTLEITGVALAIALLFGFLLALAKLSRIPLLAVPASAYIEVIRAVPVLVLLFVAYYSLGQLGVKLSGFGAAVLTLGAFYATLYGEIFRGGIVGVDAGQREAADALGMSRRQTMLKIILPQAFFAILPPSTNQMSNIIKDTSLVVTIGVADLMSQAYQASAATFLPMDMLALAGIMYFAFYLILSRVLTRWEVNVQRHRS